MGITQKEKRPRFLGGVRFSFGHRATAAPVTSSSWLALFSLTSLQPFLQLRSSSDRFSLT
jgi:hypothetical protein